MSVRDRKWVDASQIQKNPPPEYQGLETFPSLFRYTSYSFLGAGTFGRVYAAMHAGLGRIEALKRIEIADPRTRQMALAEAEILARLPPHPNLVMLYNAEIDQRAIYLSLQYIDGQPGDSLPLPLPIGQTLTLIRDTAQALQMIHAHGIVHRDIKPANLFCTRVGTGVVGDFGVAGMMDNPSQRRIIAGSPGYMAPEAFVGAAVPASDLWSLGVMLFEFLTGRRPFVEYEHLPLDQLAAAFSNARLLLPSSFRPDVPRGADDLVAMLLAVRPEDRPPSAMAVLDYLPRYNTMVSVYGGDLLLQKSDAIVYTANERLLMNKQGSLDKSIAMQGGATIQAEALRSAPCKIGQVVVTGAGNLPAKHVFHAVCLHIDNTGREAPISERDLRRALWSVFRKAHEMRLRSICLPAMGTSRGASPEDAARMMVDVTHTYLLEFRPPLEQVSFIIRDRAVAVAFREAARERGMLLV